MECPSNPWRVQNNAIFSRIDAFLERCHDVLDLTTTIAQFQKVGAMTVDRSPGPRWMHTIQEPIRLLSTACRLFEVNVWHALCYHQPSQATHLDAPVHAFL